MKKKSIVMGLFAFFLIFSLFAKNKKVLASPLYYTYMGSGDQNVISNYSFSFIRPNTLPGITKLAWFKVDDINNDGYNDIYDFMQTFSLLNQTYPNGNTLDDEAEISNVLEKKFF